MQIATKQLTNNQLVAALKKNEELAFKQVYVQSYHPIERYIIQNSGSKEDAKDLFQEALIVLVKNLRKPDFTLTVKPASYLYKVVQNMWLYKLRSNKKKPTVSIDDQDNFLQIADQIETTDYEEKHHLMEQIFTTIGADCQQLIRAFYYEKKKLIDIAETMGYTSAFAKVKKHRCMSSFKQKIKESVAFKTL